MNGGVEPPPPEPSDLPARPTLLAVCTLPPWPVRNGYALRVHNILRELAPRWTITLVAPGGAEGLGMPPGAIDHVPIALKGPGLTYPWRFDGRALRAAVDAVVRERRPDRALVWPGAEAVWFDRPDLPPAVMDMVDCNPLEFWRGTLARGSVRDRWRNLSQLGTAAWFARRTVRSFAVTACVGEADAAWMARIGGRTVHVSPNGVALPPEEALAEEVPEPTLAFTGSLDYGPNVDAVGYLAEDIWQRVRRVVGPARLVIAGRRPVPGIAALHGRDGIEVVADVPDMVPVLGRAWVAVAPMRTGVGIKNKVLEAWACGRPVVMTPLATNGLTLPPGHGGLVGEDAAALADSIVTLLRNEPERQRIGRAARAHVEQRCTWSATAAQLDRLLREAASQG